MTPYKPNVLTSVPQTLEKRREVVQALGTLVAQDGKAIRRRQAEIAEVRRDFEMLRQALPGLLLQAIADVRRDCDPRLRSRVIKYSPDQPRVPPGNPDSGQSKTNVGLPVQKASADDPEHPGWPAGTPDGKGGQFRLKDGGSGEGSNGSADRHDPVPGADQSLQTTDALVAQTTAPPFLFEEPPLAIRPPLPEFPKNPVVPPGPGFEWHGRPGSQPGDPQGSWYNPNTDETLRPDMDHPPPTPPHWDYQTPDGQWYRWFPDGRLELKS